MEKMANASCVYGDCLTYNALHTFIHCEKWSVERGTRQRIIGIIILDNIVRLMVRRETEWAKVTGFVEAVLRLKKEMIAGPQKTP